MLLSSLSTAACAARSSPLLHQQCGDADAHLAAVLQPLEADKAKGCDAASTLPGECDRLRQELERLAVICPDHTPTLMANAVIAYDDHQPVKSQQFLDRILSQPRSAPDAAALRARIAIEEGNLPFARRLIEQQLALAPDHAGLRETYGAALYMSGLLLEARRELAAARQLGAPAWRIAYHLGLIEEKSGRFDLAAQYYDEALRGKPGWPAAESRLKALRARNP